MPTLAVADQPADASMLPRQRLLSRAGWQTRGWRTVSQPTVSALDMRQRTQKALHNADLLYAFWLIPSGMGQHHRLRFGHALRDPSLRSG
jgi:hypothetical protein